MARRVLAATAAVVMVVLAIVVRTSLDDDDGTGSRADDHIEILCAPEFVDACDALGGDITVTIQDPDDTLAALVDGDIDDSVDGWFTTNAWLEVAQTRAPDGLADATAVASTETVVLADDDRAATVKELCGARAVWRCLGDEAGRPWGELGGPAAWGGLKTGVPDATTPSGLGVLVAIAAGHFGSTDFATNDFEATDLRSWLTQLVGSRTAVVPNPLTVLATRPGAFTAAGGTMAQARSLAGGVLTLDAAPVITVQAVLIQFGGRDPVPPTGPAVDVLRETGWDEPLGDIPRLLKPGVLAALFTLWTEVVR